MTGCSPLVAKRTRVSAMRVAQPERMPKSAPITSCRGISKSSRQPGAFSAASVSTTAMVRMTAVGSLTQLSTSSVVRTFSLTRRRPPRSTANTAAASVLLTIAPTSNAWPHESPSARPMSAMTPAVPATPTVASTLAGASPLRTALMDEFSPPSKRMRMRATMPMRRANWWLSSAMPPGPSEPPIMPSSRKPSMMGTPKRPSARAKTRLSAMSRPSTSKRPAMAPGSVSPRAGVMRCCPA